MKKEALPRPPPIPASPHLKQPMVVMIHDEERAAGGKQQWPPTRVIPGAPRPHDFLTKCTIKGGKRVAWPPHLRSTEDLSSTNDLPEGEFSHPVRTPGFPGAQNESGGHQHSSSPFPLGFKLRNEAPMDHVITQQVVPAQPAFKITQPMQVRAEENWPPKKNRAPTDDIRSQVREFVRPSKSNRDYNEFFAQNALPNSYPSYRAPPGTQHYGFV